MGVKLLGKIKIHEIAKEVGLTSKEVIKIANDLGIGVTSHLSAVDDSQAAKIKENIKTQTIGGNLEKEKAGSNVKKQAENTKKSDSANQFAKKENTSNAKKSETPVIIRREVIVSEDEEKEKELNRSRENRKKEVGFVERTNKNDYNIVYRNKQTKPLTVSELFGLKPKTEPAKTNSNKTETEPIAEKVVEKKEEISAKNVENISENKTENAYDVKKSTEPQTDLKDDEKQISSNQTTMINKETRNMSSYNNQQRNAKGNTRKQYEKSNRR